MVMTTHDWKTYIIAADPKKAEEFKTILETAMSGNAEIGTAEVTCKVELGELVSGGFLRFKKKEVICTLSGEEKVVGKAIATLKETAKKAGYSCKEGKARHGF